MTPTASAWLKTRARPVRGLLGAGVLVGAGQGVLICAGAWLIAYLLSRAIFDGAGLATLGLPLAGLLLVAAMRFALTLWQRHLTFEAGARVSANVRRALEQRLRERGPRWAARQSSGDLVTRLVDGVEALIPYYAGYLPQVAMAGLLPALLLCSVLFADPWSALILAFCAPLIPLFMVLVGRAAEQASQRRWLRLRRMGARFMDALSGLTTLRLCRAVEREQALLAATGELYRRETMAVLRIAFLSALVLEFFATLGIAVVAVMIGFRLLDGGIGFQAGLFVLLLAPEFFLPLRALGVQRHRRMDAVAAAEDLVGLLAADDEATDDDTTAAHRQRVPDRPLALALEGVRFGYPEQAEVLQGIDLQVPAGSRLTVVGESGGGKSTLLAMIMGFVTPTAGRLRINGIDLATLDPEDWRRHIAWVPQRAHVFHGSLRDNLTIAAPGASRIELERAIHAAALTSVVARLPQGLDSLLGERGEGLSGGERQRLALARLWLRHAPILLLDEPTQHLDAALSQRIETALATLGQDRTVIRVAHRLTAIDDDEQVAVLAHGRVVETGTAGVLRHTGGAFAALLAADRAA